MRGKFFNGLIWGGIIGSVLGAIIGPMTKPQKKPLIFRSADVVKDTTRDIMHEARRARRRLMKK